ncbi:unnamed protein product [Closterium sp. NIES-54]
MGGKREERKEWVRREGGRTGEFLMQHHGGGVVQYAGAWCHTGGGKGGGGGGCDVGIRSAGIAGSSIVATIVVGSCKCTAAAWGTGGESGMRG